MRKRRVTFKDRENYVHCISRTINREFLLGDTEKEQFLRIMRKVEAFTGVQVATYALMSNHFHILLAENERVELSDEALLDRLKAYYGAENATFLAHAAHLKQLRADGLEEAAREFHERFQKRMNDVSEFMKTLKQCFTQWYNKKNNRIGTVWSDRFKSVLVEPGSEAMSYMAAYIDLNPVRADLVDDPKDYRWSGYGEAVAGGGRARLGLERLYESDGTLSLALGKGQNAKWEVVGERYRVLVYERGVAKSDRWGNQLRPGFDRVEIQAVLDAGGSLPWHVLARCRLRYFTEGVMLGTANYVETHEKRVRDMLGLKRKRHAKNLHEYAGSGLYLFRRFRATQVSPPGPLRG